MNMKQPQKQHWYDKIRRDFLLSFFDKENKYQEKEINGFFIIKQFSNKLMNWEVAIYTKESYRKKQTHKAKISNLIETRGNKQERG